MAEQQRVAIRKGFFLRTFEELQKVFPEIYGSAQFDEADATYLAELYFLISDAYKKWRMEEGHYTNDYKKAGITSVAIMAMRPILIPSPGNLDTRPFFANPIFAAACSTAILNTPISSMPREDRDQYYVWLDTLRFPCTEGFLNDAIAGILKNREEYVSMLSHDEISQIDMLIQKLKGFCNQLELEKKIRDLTAQ